MQLCDEKSTTYDNDFSINEYVEAFRGKSSTMPTDSKLSGLQGDVSQRKAQARRQQQDGNEAVSYRPLISTHLIQRRM